MVTLYRSVYKTDQKTAGFSPG